jgi:hypothetical protein
MAGVSREQAVYRASWTAVIVAFFVVVGIGVASVAAVLTPAQRVAPVKQATSELLKLQANTAYVEPTGTATGQVCPVGKAPGITIEAGTGKVVAIHC